MIKRFVACFGFIFLMVLLFLTLVSNAWPADKTFTLTIQGKEITLNLPDEVPDLTLAKPCGEVCNSWNSERAYGPTFFLAVNHYCLPVSDCEKIPQFVISFWHCSGAILGFVLHKNKSEYEMEHIGWLYLNDVFVKTEPDDFEQELTNCQFGTIPKE